jgi:hypothetical protein
MLTVQSKRTYSTGPLAGRTFTDIATYETAAEAYAHADKDGELLSPWTDSSVEFLQHSTIVYSTKE